MSDPSSQENQRRAIADLSAVHSGEHAAAAVVHLMVGLTQIRDLLAVRLHEDVETHIGMDSMIAPMSLSEADRQSDLGKTEIDTYSAIVAAEEIGALGRLATSDRWLVDWLFRLRFGDRAEVLMKRRIGYYDCESLEERRLNFVTILQRTIPESIRAPLVLFRLYPRCVRIVAAVAFDEATRARQLRDAQCRLLPAILDCRACRGRVLEENALCEKCGNPVWDFACLRSE